MHYVFSRRLVMATLLILISVCPLSASTILKMGLGPSSPDVNFVLVGGVGELSTQDDGDPSTGDLQTNATFLNFVRAGGVANIPASEASFTLSGIKASGAPGVFGSSLVNQATEGGRFELYDKSDVLILAGDLKSGVLTGPLGTPGTQGPSTGSLFTVNLGTFILPTGADPTIYNLVDPSSAQLSMSFTNVTAADGLTSGLLIDGGVLQPFSADVTAQIEARPIPEPSSVGLAVFGLLGLVGLRRRRR